MAKNRYMSMDLNALRTFVILYQEGNMRKATTKLHVSQPALSHTLSKLRETFDDDLFIKSRHGLSPTSFAQYLYNDISPIMENLSSKLNFKRDFSPENLTGKITVAFPPNLAAILSAPLYQYITAVAPKVTLYVQHWNVNTIEALEKDKINLGINFDLTEIVPPLTQQNVMRDIGYGIVVRKDHPITATELTPKQIKNLLFAVLVLPDYNETQSHAEKFMKLHGYSIKTGFNSQFLQDVINVIKHTDLVMPCYDIIKLSNLEDLRFIKVLPTIELPDVVLNAYFHQKYRKDPVHIWLLDVVIKLLIKLN